MKVFNYAISDNTQPITFHTSDNIESSSIDSKVAGASSQAITVPGQTLEGLLNENQIDAVDLLKVDIEGAETRLFASTPLAVLERIAKSQSSSTTLSGHIRPARSNGWQAIWERAASLRFSSREAT